MIRHNFKKQYGQNFLVSTRFADELIDALNIKNTDTVIEIGPGDGMITNLILNSSSCKLIAVEVDYDLLPNLIRRFSGFDNFKLIHKDILELDLNQVIKENNISGEVKIIGALPYNISKKIIEKFLQDAQNFPEGVSLSRMAFIVQEEVAKDYVARTPQATFLSNYLQLFGEARKFKSIPAHKFYPMPKVNGAILQIILKDSLNPNLTDIKKLIRLGFSSPRKTLIRNLSNIQEYKVQDLPKIFNELELKTTVRPAELTIEDWEKLFNKIKVY